MMFRCGVAAAVLAVAAAAFAQDPTRTLPDSYKVELDNDYVRVVRVHYDAGAKLPTHTHPSGTTAYVYLNDSDGVVYRHVGALTTVINRAPVKAGAMRISTGIEEHHEVDNTSPAPSDFLRMQMKTITAGTPRRRIAADENEFSTRDIRITRVTVPPGQKAVVEAGKNPALRITVHHKGTSYTAPSADLVKWLDKGTTEEVSVTGDVPFDIIKIEFLTKPKG
jgi:hypothetical protein